MPRTEQDVLRQNETEEALADEKRLDKAAAYLFYEKGHPVQYLIHKMKYGDQPELGFWMARQAVLDCDNESFFEDIDLIVPMPLHPRYNACSTRGEYAQTGAARRGRTKKERGQRI